MTNSPNTIDTFKRARELKASALQNINILQSARTSPSANSNAVDSEDALITTLRAAGIPWGAITAQLNQRRVSNNEAPTWTEDAVYSRFVLRGSGTATPAREIGFEPRDYAHLKNAGSGREGTSKAGKKRVKDFQNATELSANIRKPAVVEAADVRVEAKAGLKVAGEKARARGKGKGKDEDRRKGGEEEEVVNMGGRMVEVLIRAVAKVERNFWVFVADEVEREGGKYIEPKELEKVFYGI